MKNATEIVVVMDKSGSMFAIQDDARGGFNSFLKEQQAVPGEAHLTLVLFNTTIDQKPRKPLLAVEPLTDKTYRPDGCTALLDALGHSINELGKQLSNLPEEERSDKVIFVVITDGQENSSLEFGNAKIKEMIEHQETKYSWQFVFLGANQDSFCEAAQFGIKRNKVSNYKADSKGMKGAFRGASYVVEQYRYCASEPAKAAFDANLDMAKVVEDQTEDSEV